MNSVCKTGWDTKEWYLNGKWHREDGPAVEPLNGTKLWYLLGMQLTREDHAYWCENMTEFYLKYC